MKMVQIMGSELMESKENLTIEQIEKYMFNFKNEQIEKYLTEEVKEYGITKLILKLKNYL